MTVHLSVQSCRSSSRPSPKNRNSRLDKANANALTLTHDLMQELAPAPSGAKHFQPSLDRYSDAAIHE